MAKAKLKIGDVVILNSGGPEMTIVAEINDNWQCAWFTLDDEVKDAIFSTAALMLIDSS